MTEERNVRPRLIIVASVALILAVAGLSSTAGLAADHRGRDFWICFPPGMTFPYVFITAEKDTNVTIDIPGLGWSDSFSLAAGQGIKREMPKEARIDYLTIDDVEYLGVHIQATCDISVYGHDVSHSSEGSYLALPTDVLGTEYIVLAFGKMVEWPLTGSGSQLAVLATEDGTAVTVVPSEDCGSRIAGIPFTISLDKGEAYRLVNLQGDMVHDLSGSRISSDKPVAVYGGLPGFYIPSDSCCADTIVEQMPPLADLGTDYLVMPYAERTCGDLLRIVAAHDQTELMINGAPLDVIGQSEYVEFLIYDPTHVTSNHPILVGQFMQSYDEDSINGDPEFLVVTATDKFLDRYTVLADDYSTWNNYLNLVAPNEVLGEVFIDGVPVNPTGFTTIGSSGYSGIQVPVSAGIHALSCSSEFGAYVYGMHRYGSYIHPAGMMVSAEDSDAGGYTIGFGPSSATLYVGSTHCVKAKITDENGMPREGVPVSMACKGVNSWQYIASTNGEGEVERCYSSTEEGVDVIIARVSAALCPSLWLKAEVTVNWFGSLPPAPVPPPPVLPELNLPYSGPLRVFPNPFNRMKAARGTVKFEGIPLGTHVRIYTARGVKAWESIVEQPYMLEWDGNNEAGKPVAPGFYIWVAESKELKQQGTLAVE